MRRFEAESAAAATAGWAALFAEGWRLAAAQADGRSRGKSEANWISCRAARAAASKRAKGKEPHARHGDKDDASDAEGDGSSAAIDFEDGVWCVEDQDRYSGAGGRGSH
jgi:hypothetical protein